MSIITPLQKDFLKQFFQSYLGRMFFLSGGTALAEFYLQHRLSKDIDVFTVDQEVSFDTVNAETLKIASQLRLSIEHQITSPTFLQYIFKDKKNTPLKVDLVKDVPIHFGKLKKVGEIQVDSLENIAVGKLLAVFSRADAKDFIDLYFLLEKEKKIDFDGLFSMAKRKDTGLHELYLAQMLAMVENVNLFPDTLKPLDEVKLRSYFLQLSEQLLRKIKPAD